MSSSCHGFYSRPVPGLSSGPPREATRMPPERSWMRKGHPARKYFPSQHQHYHSKSFHHVEWFRHSFSRLSHTQEVIPQGSRCIPDGVLENTYAWNKLADFAYKRKLMPENTSRSVNIRGPTSSPLHPYYILTYRKQLSSHILNATWQMSISFAGWQLTDAVWQCQTS